MANQEHLDILKQGVGEWKIWREEHSDIQADLSRANLTRANLSRTDLSRAILLQTNFTDAILTNCVIYGISAWDVKLERAIQDNLIITLPNAGSRDQLCKRLQRFTPKVIRSLMRKVMK